MRHTLQDEYDFITKGLVSEMMDLVPEDEDDLSEKGEDHHKRMATHHFQKATEAHRMHDKLNGEASKIGKQTNNSQDFGAAKKGAKTATRLRDEAQKYLMISKHHDNKCAYHTNMHSAKAFEREAAQHKEHGLKDWEKRSSDTAKALRSRAAENKSQFEEETKVTTSDQAFEFWKKHHRSPRGWHHDMTAGQNYHFVKVKS